jgi:L-seryl-tRNA(Ser) seleniumtransferase/D-glucosaminate-6-phosphate ammonia-lyase
MSVSPFQALGLNKVINASGKMTALGGSAQATAVAEVQQQAAGHHVNLAALRRAAGRQIAERTGAEDACVTTGAAAGIAIGVAAMITGTDEEAVRRLPDSGGLPDEIVLQAGHDVNFGARVTQMIRLGGGRPVLVGNRDEVTQGQLESVLSGRTAGLVFVQSHHTRQANGLSLEALVRLARARRLPVLVDAAAEEDLEAYVSGGADLVTYSGGKAIGGPTVGFIAGRKDLIAACELQNLGIARAMKVGKEQIAGLIAALDAYPTPSGWSERLHRLKDGLEAVPGARISVEEDLAGRNIQRLGLRLEPAALKGLVHSLASGDPAIYTRNHQIDEGLVLFDLREVADEDVDVIIERVGSLLRS